MNVKIRVVKDFNKEEQLKLKELGIQVETGWDAFEIDEKNPIISNVKSIFDRNWDSIIQREASFSEKDRTLAPYLNIWSNKMLGYAKPDVEDEVDGYSYPFDIYPYYKDIFEVENTDENYGLLRGKQIGLYSLEGEPKWGKNGIASANYIEDAFFVTPEIYESIFKPLNINYLPVLNYKTGKNLKTVVQLLQQGISQSKLNINNSQIKEAITVKKWDLRKYILKNDDYYPSFINSPEGLDFFYTQEYFGDGGYNQRNTIISQKLYQILKNNHIKGLTYYPQKADVHQDLEQKHSWIL